jgi:hypothetical protein
MDNPAQLGADGDRDNSRRDGSADTLCAMPHMESSYRIFDSNSLATGGLYVALSVFFIGRKLIFDFGGSYVGRHADPSLFIWSISWWPYALSHRLNPIISHAIYSPVGTNLAWLTTVPLASIMISPVTATFGPVVSYNLLALLAPASAAWAAYILCRYLTKSNWPAVVGGYVFGFSPYFLAQTLAGHLHMVLIVPVPIALYLVARWFDEAIESRTMAWLTSLALAAQLLLSLEVFATATMFGGLALLLGFGSVKTSTRWRIAKLIGILACSYGLALLITCSFIYYVYVPGHLGGSITIAEQFSADSLNFLVPTSVNALGLVGPLPKLARAFPGNLFERNAYVGPVLILLAILYARRYWRQPFGKTLVDSLLIICILSLDPVMQIGGHGRIALPGYLLAKTPLINGAVSARFMMFAFLILAIITAQWLAMSGTSLRNNLIVAMLVVMFSLPNLDGGFWVTKSDTPQFFAGGLYKKYLKPNENVLVTPYSLYGKSMLWQAQSGFYFRMAGGWTGVLPDEYTRWPVIDALTLQRYLPDPQMQLMSFLSAHQVTAIVSANGDPAHEFCPQWLPAGAAEPLKVGGVTLYRLAPEALSAYRTMNAAEAERRADSAIFNGLFSAAAKYQTEHRNTSVLTPRLLEKLRLLPAEWTVCTADNDNSGAQLESYRQVWIGYIDKSLLGIGIRGSYDALATIIDQYREYASQIYFPYPQAFSASHHSDGGYLIILFNPEGMKQAIEANSHLIGAN